MTPKQRKLRDEQKARVFFESQEKGKLEKSIEIDGYTYHLSYSHSPGEDREFVYRSTCPVEGCNQVITADDNGLGFAHALCVGRIKSHFKICHEKNQHVGG